MLKKYCVLYIDNIPVSKHIIKEVNYGEKGFYRNTVSMNAFSEKESKYYLKNPLEREKIRKRTDVFNCKEYFMDREISKDSIDKIEKKELKIDPQDGTPIHYHNDLKDFYKAVGYDIKEKKYI